MLDLKAQSQLIDASATLMRTCVVAAASTMSASACQGMALWMQMMETQSTLVRSWDGRNGNAWSPLAGWQAWSRAAGNGARLARPDALAVVAKPADPGYASYRSSGGHATAQVIIGT